SRQSGRRRRGWHVLQARRGRRRGPGRSDGGGDRREGGGRCGRGGRRGGPGRAGRNRRKRRPLGDLDGGDRRGHGRQGADGQGEGQRPGPRVCTGVHDTDDPFVERLGVPRHADGGGLPEIGGEADEGAGVGPAVDHGERGRVGGV